jgi:hypothetical protein
MFSVSRVIDVGASLDTNYLASPRAPRSRQSPTASSNRLIFSQALLANQMHEPKWLIQLAALKYKLEPFCCRKTFPFVNIQHQRDITTAQHFILFL